MANLLKIVELVNVVKLVSLAYTRPGIVDLAKLFNTAIAILIASSDPVALE